MSLTDFDKLLGKICSKCYVTDEERIRLRNYAIKEYLEEMYPENPYPKDIFTWDNPELKSTDMNPLLTKGKFNEWVHGIWELPKKIMLERLKDEECEDR